MPMFVSACEGEVRLDSLFLSVPQSRNNRSQRLVAPHVLVNPAVLHRYLINEVLDAVKTRTAEQVSSL